MIREILIPQVLFLSLSLSVASFDNLGWEES